MNSRLCRRTLLQMGAAAAAAAAGARLGVAETVDPPQVQEPATAAAAGNRKPLRTRGVFMHVWDLQDEGVDPVLGWTRDSGLNQVHIAGSYHAGWFVHPGKPQRRLHMTEGGVLYFPPDPAIFKSTPIQPAVASIVRETNWLRRNRFVLLTVSSPVAGKLLAIDGDEHVSSCRPAEENGETARLQTPPPRNARHRCVRLRGQDHSQSRSSGGTTRPSRGERCSGQLRGARAAAGA